MRWLATCLVGVAAIFAVHLEWEHLQSWRLRDRAESSYYEGRLDETLARYEAVLDRRPGEPQSYTDPADTVSQYLSGTGQALPLDEFERLTRQAVQYYLQALDASPPSSWTYARIASLADSLRQRRFQDRDLDLARLSGDLGTLTPEDRLCEAAWVKAVQIEPRNFYYRDHLGDFYLRRGFRQRALDHFRHAVRLHPVLEKHYYLSEFAEASPDVLRAVEKGVQDALATDHPDVSPFNIHRLLAELYLRLDRFEDAEASFEAAAEVTSEPQTIDVHLGLLLAEKGDDPGALEAFRRATQRKPDYSRAWMHLGLALSRNDRHDEALEAAYKARGLNPGDYTTSSVLARVLEAAGRLDDAATILEHLARSDPDRRHTYSKLIEIYESQGKLSQAIRIARQLSNRFPEEEVLKRQLEQLERSRSSD